MNDASSSQHDATTDAIKSSLDKLQLHLRSKLHMLLNNI